MDHLYLENSICGFQIMLHFPMQRFFGSFSSMFCALDACSWRRYERPGVNLDVVVVGR
jgi:hypothetical protein